MTIRVKTYVLIGVICYAFFLGWYFYRSHELSNTRWQPSDVYTQIGDISETMGAAAPTANQVFDAKVNVPMTSRSKHRIANYKRTGKRPVRMMALNRRKSSSSTSVISPTNTSSPVTPVGEGLHTLSSATFHSFGAWGLMSPNYGKTNRNSQRNTTQAPDATTLYLYPWYMSPQPAENTKDAGNNNKAGYF